MSLKEYQRKRKFTLTPEPKGSQQKTDLARFVVQKHHASHLHYDFRLEMDGVLKSWAVPKGPSMNPNDKRLAMMVEDHPIEYLNFSGTIPKGEYGAGTVEIWDSGKVDFINSDLIGGHLTIVLNGKKLNGEFALIKLQHSKEKNAWLLIKASKDKSTSNKYTATSEPEKYNNKMPHITTPMLATLTDHPFDRANWIFEIKWDGYRAIAEIDGGKTGINLYSRNEKSFNNKFPEIVEGLTRFGHKAVLDGEIVVLDKDGKSSFQGLQQWQQNHQGKLVYYVFDLLYLDGQDLRDLNLSERKRILKETLPEIDNIKYSDHVAEKGKEFFKAAIKNNIEGIIAKDAKSPYVEARTKDWLKIKNINEQETVIAGYTKPRASREYFGALILGVYENKKLVYVGHTGSGFDTLLLKDLYNKMQPLITEASPFDIVPKTNEPATWLEPKLVAEIKFAEWTSEGIMRQPIFLGLREDKSAREVRREYVK